MRTVAFFVLMFMIAAIAAGQEETLFEGETETSGFGAPVLKYTNIRNQGALMFGGRGGWIINHTFVIGGGGYSVVTDVNAPATVYPFAQPLDIKFEYGGLEVEYLFNPNSLGHFGLYILIGGGTIRYVKDIGEGDSNQQTGENDYVFVLEPAVTGELNVTTWFRLNAGLSYRHVSGVTQVGLKQSDFAGLTGTLTFKFGTF
ncbi:MAG TPA: hypothetical protein VJB38_10510 [Bacteroidota bacterium]|nr:hypothetical protein [Bacteroidota bacterium]